MADLKPEVQELSTKIQGAIDASGGSLVLKDPSLYVSTLPDGIDADTIKKLKDHDTVFAAAALHAVGETGIGLMKKDKDLERVTLDIPTVGKDAFSVVFDKTYEYTQGGERKTGFGQGNVKLSFHGATAVGQVGVVKGILKAKTAEAFGD